MPSTVSTELVIKFAGGLADSHRLPAYEAGRSLYGLSRAVIIPINYLHEGRVRHKNFSNKNYQVNLAPYRGGSFEVVYEIIYTLEFMIAAALSFGVGIAGNFATDFLKSVWRRTIGGEAEPSIEGLEATGELSSGDMGALSDAIEPALKQGHAIINYGVVNINIFHSGEKIAELDKQTKEYIWSKEIDSELRVKNFSVASFNANTYNGRFYDYEAKKTVPFEIQKGVADSKTIAVLGESISLYARRKGSQDYSSRISVKYTRNIALNGATKKVFVFKARKEMAEL